jgi:hypothetical protein
MRQMQAAPRHEVSPKALRPRRRIPLHISFRAYPKGHIVCCSSPFRDIYELDMGCQPRNPEIWLARVRESKGLLITPFAPAL